jgi:DNA repair protein RadC
MFDRTRLRDLPMAERPRERLAALGAQSLTTGELLAILLRTGVKGASALELGDRLLTHFSSLQALARAPLDEIQLAAPGVGRDKAVTLKAAFELAARLVVEVNKETPVDTPERAAAVLRERMIAFETERLFVMHVNTRRKLIRVEEVGHGLLDSVLTHPREVFRKAIQANAHSVILVHNHPGGDPAPSEADIRITRDILRASRLLRIDLLDHVIIGRRSDIRPCDFVSLRELGYFHD